MWKISSESNKYIFGERLKNIATSKQDEILDLTKYTTINVDTDGHDFIPITARYNGKRLIATYSAKRAAKDKAGWEEKLIKSQAFIDDPSKLEKKPNTITGKENEKTSTCWMGKNQAHRKIGRLFCIATNNTDLSVEVILNAYKQLYNIEHSFRSFKAFLETRPMFHWTEKRVCPAKLFTIKTKKAKHTQSETRYDVILLKYKGVLLLKTTMNIIYALKQPMVSNK